MSGAPETAAGQGLAGCRICHLVSRLPARYERAESPRCPRCGARLHSRHPRSLERTAALLIAATVLYIPANVLPVMTVIQLGRGHPDTIISGIEQLVLSNMLPLAALVFFASIVVPVLKIVALGTLVWTVHRRSRWRLEDRTRIYRLTETVGRWSMLDIYVIAVLVALVQLGTVVNIAPGPGAISFAAVVVLTMTAAMTFDPRLMWDVAHGPDG